MDWFGDRESVFEIGIVVFLGLILGGVAILIGGQAFEKVGGELRHRAAPPSRGDVPPSRHRGTASAAPR